MRSCAPPRREDSAPQERRARSHEAAGYRHRAPPFITIPAIPNSQCLQGQRIPPGFRTADTLPVRSGRLYRRHARGRAGRGQARRQWIRSSVRPEPAHDRRIPGNMSVAEPGSEMLVLPGHGLALPCLPRKTAVSPAPRGTASHRLSQALPPPPGGAGEERRRRGRGGGCQRNVQASLYGDGDVEEECRRRGGGVPESSV